MDHIDSVLATSAIDDRYCLAVQAALTIGKKTLNHYYSKTDLSKMYRIAMGNVLLFIPVILSQIAVLSSPPTSQVGVFQKGRLDRRLDQCREEHGP